MKRYILLGFVFVYILTNAQNKSTNDTRTTVLKSENNWNKQEADNTSNTNIQYLADGISYSTKADGIFLTLPKSTSNVKLFSLTGEAVWSGNLVQGRFFIPTRAGIYFLRINNKSYKIVCK